MHWIEQGGSVCLIRLLTGLPCYGCGMTRALFALLHLDFAAAWTYHPASYPVAVLLGYLYFRALAQAIGRP